jgi:CHAD domain-containing protein
MFRFPARGDRLRKLGLIPGKWLEGLEPEMPVAVAVGRMLDRHSAMLRAGLPAVVEHGMEDVESVHRLRVATRRLTAVLELFRDLFGDRTATSVRKLLRKIRRDCSLARDLDVQRQFYESLLGQAHDREKPGLKYLIQQNVGKRIDVQGRLHDHVPKYRMKMDQYLARFDRTLRDLPAEESRKRGTLHAAGASLLPQRLNSFWKLADEVDCQSNRLHELRIACKKLRYAFDVFAPVLTNDFRANLYPELQLLQESLGEIQDATVGLNGLKDIRRKHERRSQRAGRAAAHEWKRLSPGISVTRLAYKRVRKESRRKLRDFWPRFAAAEFRERLERSCSTLELQAIPL